MNRRVVGAILTLLALAVLVAVGYGAYQAGWERGLTATDPEAVRPHLGPGYRPFFPFGFLFPLLFFFLFFWLIAKAFWWRPWRGPGSGGEHMEDHLRDWHRRAHEGGTAS
ncbi:MAG: hypothetical protein ACRDXD_13745 [Acidimicrobiia bacterium]